MTLCLFFNRLFYCADVAFDKGGGSGVACFGAARQRGMGGGGFKIGGGVKSGGGGIWSGGFNVVVAVAVVGFDVF